jgi:hypothetical protein
MFPEVGIELQIGHTKDQWTYEKMHSVKNQESKMRLSSRLLRWVLFAKIQIKTSVGED